MHKIFVLVEDGVATVREDTLPTDTRVEIIDLDLIRTGESFPSPEAFKYCQEKNIFIERRRNNFGTPTNGQREEDKQTVGN
jgi:hypothetical protein